MKHVNESLNEFYNYKFFSSLNEEDKKDKEDKAEMRNKEKDGLSVIDKITKDFDDFKKEADGKIAKYKEFWEENQKHKKAFSESGNIYKMFSGDYVIGVLELPIETLSDGSIDGGMGASDEPEEEIIEGKEMPTPELLTNEAEEPENNLNLDLDKPEETDTALDNSGDDSFSMNEPGQEEMGQKDTLSNDLKSPQKYFVVYDISGDEREEILRTGSNNVVNAFNSFYNDKFKGAMKDIIVKYQEKKKELKIEAEKSEKQKVEKDKDSKIKKFLGEN